MYLLLHRLPLGNSYPSDVDLIAVLKAGNIIHDDPLMYGVIDTEFVVPGEILYLEDLEIGLRNFVQKFNIVPFERTPLELSAVLEMEEFLDLLGKMQKPDLNWAAKIVHLPYWAYNPAAVAAVGFIGESETDIPDLLTTALDSEALEETKTDILQRFKRALPFDTGTKRVLFSKV